jgi:hypothetical protein
MQFENAPTKKKFPAPTREENLTYTLQMLRELKPKADEVDFLLAHLIDMAILQANDLFYGRVDAEAERSRAASKKRYGS